jgi:hypothetical protein
MKRQNEDNSKQLGKMEMDAWVLDENEGKLKQLDKMDTDAWESDKAE